MKRLSAPEKYFLPYQLRWIQDDSRAKICEKSRRIGWTYCSSFRRVRRSLAIAGNDSWWMTRDLITAREFIRYCRKWCDLANSMATGLEGDNVQLVDPKNDVKAQVIEFPNGSRIFVLSSNPDAAAGKGGDIGLDEFALHADQERLYQVARPVIMWGCQLEIISTHRGRDTIFNRLVQQARTDPEWSLHSVTIQQAVDAGLVEKINRAAADHGLPPLTRADFLERERAACLDDSMWLQEYMCTPADDAGSLLSYEMIAACEANQAELHESAETGKEVFPDRAAYAGMDIGRRHDLTVIWVVEVLGKVAYTRQVEVLGQCPFFRQLEVLGEVLERHRVRRCCIDASGMGAMLAEEAARHFAATNVEAVTFTLAAKEDLALGLWRRFQDRTIRVPADAVVREDLHKVQRQVTSAGNIRYQAAADAAGHADRFWALALAVRAAAPAKAPRPDGVRLPTPRRALPIPGHGV